MVKGLEGGAGASPLSPRAFEQFVEIQLELDLMPNGAIEIL